MDYCWLVDMKKLCIRYSYNGKIVIYSILILLGWSFGLLQKLNIKKDNLANFHAFRCADGDFYVALGSSMSLVWVGGGLLKRVLYYFGNEPSLGRKFSILHLSFFMLLSTEDLGDLGGCWEIEAAHSLLGAFVLGSADSLWSGFFNLIVA